MTNQSNSTQDTLIETAEWADSMADQSHMASVRGDLIRLATKCRTKGHSIERARNGR